MLQDFCRSLKLDKHVVVCHLPTPDPRPPSLQLTAVKVRSAHNRRSGKGQSSAAAGRPSSLPQSQSAADSSLMKRSGLPAKNSKWHGGDVNQNPAVRSLGWEREEREERCCSAVRPTRWNQKPTQKRWKGTAS